MYFSFQSTEILSPWLNLLLVILFFFDAIVNGIFFFLISLYDSSFLVHRNATDICIWISQTATLLHSSILILQFFGCVFSVFYIRHLQIVTVLHICFHLG